MVNEKKDSPEQAVGYQIDPKPSSKIDKGHNAGLVPLNLPQPLSLDEKKYLLAVERGDIASVRRILQRAHRKHHLSINCMDPLGRRALSVAIDSENLEMVELLVIMGVETKDALLQAINAEFVEAVELLLEHEELIYNEGDQYSWQKVDINTAMFAPDITPLILAAHKNNFEILKLLLDRGAAVPIPHDIRCGCEECVRQSTQDSLRHSLSRVNIYKALASPSFICLTSSDPILTAFQLSWELRSIASTEQECKSEYVELRRQCQKFAVDLLDETRSSQELAIILNHDPDAPPYADGDRMTLARLVQAINFKQKKFVAHPNIQQLLAAIWYEGVPGFRRKSVMEKLLTIVQVAVLFPVYCVMYMIAPTNSTGILMRKPFMKFLIHASSYLFFLLILILVSQRAEDFAIEFFGTDEMKENLQQRTKRQRGNGPGSLELLVALYVTGFIWEEIQEIYNVGIKSYLRNMWNFIDFTRNTLYVSVMCLRILAYLQQSSEIAENPQMAYIPREDWDDFDPQLIAEGLFAAANVFSALKLVHLFSINPHLGPLQISLGRMVIDIVKFFFIYSLLLFAFACGLNQLLWYFADLEKKKCYHLPNNQADWAGNSDACMKWRRFGNLFESSQSLFWASFGMVGLENFELQGIKSYTRFWGLLMFGSYSVINVIVLLNLLIAMMSNSYAMIELHSDTEWKFARTKLWMSYFDNSATLPPPFNILPSVKWLIRLFRKSSHAIELKKSLKRAEAAEQRYHNIMRALVWRYVSSKQRKCEDSLVTEDDINEVKTEISAMRYEILEIFDDNGMDVSSAAKKEKPVRAKRAKIWERRLMKDFHVAPVPSATAGTNTDDDDMSEIKIETEPSAPQGPPLNEAPKAKFIRVAKQVASDSIAHKWNAVLQGVAKNSQIGRCNDKKSYENLQNLEKAIEEARKLIMFSPPPRSGAISPIDFDDEKSSTLLGLLNKISAELDPQSNQNELTGVMKQLTADSQLKLQKIKKTPVQQDLKSKNIVNERNSITMNPSTALNKITTDRVAQNVPGSAVKAPNIKVIKPDEEVVLSAEALGKSQSQIKTIPTGPSQTTSQLKPALKKAPPPPPTQISSSDTPKDVSVKQMGHSKVHPSDHQQVNPPGANKRREPQHDSFDIQVMSLNDSHEVLVNRPSSPDSDCSSVTASPRNKVGGVRGPQPKSGWL